MFMKKLIAGALAGVMILSATVSAAPPAPSNLAGTGQVLNPVYAVLLPAAPVIRINPFQIGGGEAPLVSSPWYVIANRSSVPVDITMSVGTNAAVPADVIFQANNTWAGTARQAHLQIMFAAPTTSTVLTDGAAAAALGNVAWEDGNAQATVSLLGPLTVTGSGANMSVTGGETFRVVLGPRQLIDGNEFNPVTGAANFRPATEEMLQNQFAAFTFIGGVNPAANWLNNQVAARIVFRIAPVSGAVFNTIACISNIGTVNAFPTVGNAANVWRRATPHVPMTPGLNGLTTPTLTGGINADITIGGTIAPNNASVIASHLVWELVEAGTTAANATVSPAGVVRATGTGNIIARATMPGGGATYEDDWTHDFTIAIS